MIRAIPAFAFAILFTGTPTFANDTITGTASVTDGDTLEIGDKRIRLYGIDAPESAQLCQDAVGKDWRCGQRAALALSDWTARRSVRCEVRNTDRYGRSVSACSVGGESLNAWMVTNGWAMAYRQYSKDYVDAEATARASRAGIWAGTFQPPWDWRKDKRESKRPQPANQDIAALGGSARTCKIKGNISTKGERIFHMPGGRFYEQTQISERSGERWFCSEAEAEAAGWRRSAQ